MIVRIAASKSGNIRAKAADIARGERDPRWDGSWNLEAKDEVIILTTYA